jgi:hypothetical protein
VRIARLLIVIVGVLLPFAARIPGAFVYGPDWLTSYLSGGLSAVLFISAFNCVCWVAILLATSKYKHVGSVWFPATAGFLLPLAAHASLDLSSDSTAAIALIFIPFASLPLVLIGWLLGLWFDRRHKPQADSVETQ